MMSLLKPKICLIVPCLNQECLLKKNWSNLDFGAVSVIFLPGRSCDGSLGFIEILSEKYPNVFCVSGPDASLYDAWNKGLNFVLENLNSVEWVGFLGADDSVLHPELLGEAIIAAAHCNHISFETVIGQHTMTEYDSTSLIKRMNFAHVGSLHRISLFRSQRFDTTYRIVADYEFFLRNKDVISSYHATTSPYAIGVSGVSQSRAAVWEAFKVKLRYSDNFLSKLEAGMRLIYGFIKG